MPRPFLHATLIALLMGMSGCGSTDTAKSTRGLAATEWGDTGVESAPSDATWEADESHGGSEPVGADAAYDGLRPLRPDVGSAAEDDTYRSGEVVSIRFSLANIGEHDYHHHPGLILTTDHPGVELPEPDQWVDALEAGDSVWMEWWAVVEPHVESGDELRFTATVSAWGCEDSDEGCPVAHTASIRVQVD